MAVDGVGDGQSVSSSNGVGVEATAGGRKGRKRLKASWRRKRGR